MSQNDELPVFRPRMGHARRSDRAQGPVGFRNAVLYGGRAFAKSGGRAPPKMRVAVNAPTMGSRRVIVKVHVARMGGKSSVKVAALHLQYIQRLGVEKDGSPGVLYGADGPVSSARFEEPLPGEKHMFRMIVSPEDADELDLTDYVRRYMQRVETDLGRKIQWAAVNHHDTDNPHAHIVIRGVDRDGEQVRMDRAYVSQGLRWRAQELATEDLGQRREEDLERARRKEVLQLRYTSLDRELARRLVDGTLDVRAPEAGTRIPPTVLTARLAHLESMGLAERVRANRWRLAPTWERDLRDLGIRGDIVKQMHKALRGDPSRYRIVRSPDALDPAERKAISGRLAGKGLADELKGTYYAVVEASNGRAYHVPIDARSFETAKVGDVVTLAGEDGKRSFALRKDRGPKRPGPDRERDRS